MRVIAFLALLATTAVAAADEFVNEQVSRFVDLTSASVVRESVDVLVKARSAAASTYQLAFALPAPAHVAVSSRSPASGRQGNAVDCIVQKGVVKGNVQYYDVTLPKTLAKDDSIRLLINSAYTHALAPFPKEVEQFPKSNKDSARQFLVYKGHAYFWTPYTTDTQETAVRLSKSNVLSYSTNPSPVDKSGPSITYGPYSNVPAVTTSKDGNAIQIHYENTDAILVARTYRRLVEVSHWGSNLAVEEHYDLHHEGAKLKGFFSRIDYPQTAHTHSDTNVVKGFSINLPKDASDVYYKDTIGNVSWSNFRNERGRSLLEMRPRYPLYGGWRYSWFHGYNAPLTDFLKFSTSNEYVLAVPFLGGIPNITYDSVLLRVVLPEGSSNIKVHSPFSIDSQTEKRHYTYLDTIGRPALILEKTNVVDEFNGPIYISYTFPSYMLLLKPFVVSAFILAFYLVCIVYVRLDLSIIKNPEEERRLLLDSYCMRVTSFDKKLTKLYSALQALFEHHKDKKSSVDAFKVARTSTDSAANLILAELEKIAALAEAGKNDLSKSFSSVVRELISVHKDKLGKVKGMHSEVIRFSVSGDSSDQTRKKQVQDSLSKSKAEIDQLDASIESLISKLR